MSWLARWRGTLGVLSGFAVGMAWLAGAARAAEVAGSVPLHWLEGRPAVLPTGVTWGVPWPRGTVQPTQALEIQTEDGKVVPSQSWPLAYWPDGSLKWSAHAMAPTTQPAQGYRVVLGEAAVGGKVVKVAESGEAVEVDTGVIRCRIKRSGAELIERIDRDGKPILAGGELVCLRQDRPTPEDSGSVTREAFTSEVEKVAVEQSGPVRAVVRIEGTHKSAGGRAMLPFVVRLYFAAGSDAVRMMHTFVYDADEQKDFICGVGVRFSVPMRDALYDRHVRFVGEEHGVFAEAVRPITGLRRDPGKEVREAQVAGRATPPIEQWDRRVSGNIELVPAWGDFTLTQVSADGFAIRKRTREGYGWIPAAAGHRASGVGYIGGPSGGVAWGIRDFWQKYPGQLDVRNAVTDRAQVTAWLWAPDAPAMDMRFYHDTMGMETYPKQRDGLDITYEDYEPGYGTPYGIARTSELTLWAAGATPANEALAEFADQVRRPAMLACDPARYLEAKVFGGIWTLPDRSTPLKASIEDKLAFLLDGYLREVDQRSWYGFWDYGDVMHSYDDDRHVWRYDIGGFAWDNSELSTDLWLWYSFLRTGRADVFRMAEAMTRHTGEVDVYHLGKFKGLGSRHNVQHWGCSSKQTRISTAIYRRPYYFLTADERVGDLLREQLTEGETWPTNDVGRKLRPDGAPAPATAPRSAAPLGGMTWGSLMSAWLSEVERTNDPKLREKLLTSVRTMGEMPNAFFVGGATMDLDTGAVKPPVNGSVGAEHLNAMFGLPEICAELVATYGDQYPKFAQAWAQYGDLYNGTAEQRKKELGAGFRIPGSMPDLYSRCTAFAAWYRHDPKLAQRAWRELLGKETMEQRKSWQKVTHLQGPVVIRPIDEAPLGTNGAAQWSLAAIENLALVGDQMP